jgi:calcineurin-like phosphoesterase family protein
MKTYVTADLHFGHRNVIDFCARPYTDIHEMNEALIHNWNSIVRPTDLVIVAGDVFWRTLQRHKRAAIFSRLAGHKLLVVGNHDDRYTLSLPWSSVQGSLLVAAKGISFNITHYPPEQAALGRPGQFALHGHIHSKEPRMPVYDIGVDANGMRPILLDDLADMAREYMARWRNLAELARANACI